VQIDAHQGQSRVVGAHGFITAPDILALLCQLDADAVLDGLAGARPELPVPAPNVRRNRYERRIARRVGQKDLRPDLRLSMQGASRVELVNISETGVLVETSTRAILGSVEDLFISSEQRCHVVRARAVRSSVVAIESGSLVYRTAYQFEEPLSLGNLLRRSQAAA
jgi:hypothetical protein